VICVTHLPQIASFGDSHFHIRKDVTGDRTQTQVRAVEGKARVDELAIMLGAETETTRKSVKEMLDQVQEEKKHVSS
jgi:DNA repair protein RecN (Recombination protein N)